MNEEAFLKAFKYVEDFLIEMRDIRCSVLVANGVVVREADGSPSDVIRASTKDILRMGIESYLEHNSK
jgi:hypothetical protein